MTALDPRLSVRDLSLDGRRVFVRADFNVPLSDGRVADDTRLRAALPTLEAILEAGGSLVLASHLGRPGGRPDPGLSLHPVADRLKELLSRDVTLTGDCTSAETAATCRDLQPGQAVLLENLRFHPEEKAGDEGFARLLAAHADLYVNDAFGTCHRRDASVVVTPTYFTRPAAGLLVEREVKALRRVLVDPERPFAAVLGGAKVSDKLPVLRHLLPQVDRLLIGGAMAYTFLAARGLAVGRSRVDADLVGPAEEIFREAEDRGVLLLLPVDHVVARSPTDEASARVVGVDGIGPDDVAVDVGPETAAAFGHAISECRTVVWNGPLGVFETPRFAEGTRRFARAVAASRAFSVVGGGDSVAALAQAGLANQVGHVSTGGGAMLELLAGAELPGLEALTRARVAS